MTPVFSEDYKGLTATEQAFTSDHYEVFRTITKHFIN